MAPSLQDPLSWQLLVRAEPDQEPDLDYSFQPLSPDHFDFHILIKLTDSSNLSISILFDKNSSFGVI